MTEPNSQAILDALLSRCHEIRTPCGDGHLVWRVWGGAAPELPALVLLHGGFGAWNHWVRTIAALEPYYRVIAPDLPGCGDSDDWTLWCRMTPPSIWCHFPSAGYCLV
jgi:pimeloyl-ACP methyl ester carboxylesterase